jgi:hypothetical protein
MKQVLKRSFACLLAFVVLVSSSGVVVAAHTCLSESKTDVSLFQAKGCCASHEKACTEPVRNGTHLVGKCCQLTISLHKINVTVSSVKTQSSSPDATVISIPAGQAPSLFSANVLSSFFNKAPPDRISGVAFLHLTGSLLI